MGLCGAGLDFDELWAPNRQRQIVGSTTTSHAATDHLLAAWSRAFRRVAHLGFWLDHVYLRRVIKDETPFKARKTVGRNAVACRPRP